MTHDEMIAVIQAHKDGAKIQYKDHGCDRWIDTPSPAWDFPHATYRVKPEPREWFLCGGEVCHGEGCDDLYNCIHRIKVREVLE